MIDMLYAGMATELEIIITLMFGSNMIVNIVVIEQCTFTNLMFTIVALDEIFLVHVGDFRFGKWLESFLLRD